jgi:hypothetical protein
MSQKTWALKASHSIVFKDELIAYTVYGGDANAAKDESDECIATQWCQ